MYIDSSLQPTFKNWGVDCRNDEAARPCSRLKSDPPGEWCNKDCADPDTARTICSKDATVTTDAPSTDNPDCKTGHGYYSFGLNYKDVFL